MADLSITASQVQEGSDAVLEHGTAGEAVTAGQVVYLKTSDQKYWLAQADDADNDTVRGIALHDAAANQPLTIQREGTVTLGAGAGPAAGTVYVLSATAGGIAPEADLVSTDYVSVLGVGDGSSGLKLNIHNSGVAHA